MSSTEARIDFLELVVQHFWQEKLAFTAAEAFEVHAFTRNEDDLSFFSVQTSNRALSF